MALTIVKGRHTMSVVFDGSTAWDSGTDYPDGFMIESMEFKPTATDDVMIVRELVSGGCAYFNEKAATEYDNKIKYFNTEDSSKRFFPYVVGAEGSSGAMLILELK